jgi:ribosomal protein S8
MDTISDMLTRIRNASDGQKTEVVLPYSKFKHNLAKVLHPKAGSVGSVKKKMANSKALVLELKYTQRMP